MDKRIVIGLLFSYDENWIGGSYYIMNLIQSLLLLDDSDKPELVIISDSTEDFEKIKELHYPYIQYKSIRENQHIFSRILNKITRNSFLKRNVIKNIDAKIDLVFPSSGNPSLSWIKKHLFWIPDFQELHLPQFFPDLNLAERKQSRKIFSHSDNSIIFSSLDALKDYNFFFPNNNTKNQVLNFAVFHPDFTNLDDEVLAKYDLDNRKYFFSPNQFWKHKNHLVVLKAVLVLKNQSKLDFTVAFSGKESDYRNPGYFDELKAFVAENELQDHIRFLGFIDRKEQLFLMNKAVAIVQPSLFEGWSSVVEDAKSLNQNCIVSDLEVHREQLGEKASYFDPYNENELADILLKYNAENILKPNFNYHNSRRHFGSGFMKIVNNIAVTK